MIKFGFREAVENRSLRSDWTSIGKKLRQVLRVKNFDFQIVETDPIPSSWGEITRLLETCKSYNYVWLHSKLSVFCSDFYVPSELNDHWKWPVTHYFFLEVYIHTFYIPLKSTGRPTKNVYTFCEENNLSRLRKGMTSFSSHFRSTYVRWLQFLSRVSPTARYTFVESDMCSTCVISSYIQFQVTSNQMTSIPGNFRLP